MEFSFLPLNPDTGDCANCTLTPKTGHDKMRQTNESLRKERVMDKKELLQYAREQFGASPEYLWARYPSYCVLRHAGNRKWFAAVMDVPGNKLGLPGDRTVEILDVKCDPVLLGSLLGTEGFLPAYHMNKSSWVTILLDGSVADDEITGLLNISYRLTEGKK